MLNFLKTLFSKKKHSYLDSFSLLGTDIHSHLIANIDDGTKTIDESIDIILEMKSLGISKIITTPHTMKGGYNNTAKIITKGYKELIKELENRKIDIKIEVASEYYMDESFIKLLTNKNEILTFGDNYLLFEMSYMTKHSNMKSVFFDMNIAEYKPVLAHPERYPYLYGENLDKFKEIKKTGVLFQINLFSLVGYYGKSAKLVAEQLIDAEMVDFVGTDIHNTSQLKVLKSCLKSKYVNKILNYKNLKNQLL